MNTKVKMRMPAVPLITIDPFFSIWSYDNLNDRYPFHWSGTGNAILGTVTVDGEAYCFMGDGKQNKLEQISVDADALNSSYVFEGAGIRLKAEFTSPLLIESLYYSSRPVGYIKMSYESTDGNKHSVSVKISCSEELVLNRAGEGRALSEQVHIKGISAMKMGKANQKVLGRVGDDVRIDWGYLYLAVPGTAECGTEVFDDLYAVYAEATLDNEQLFILAYDDIDSITYFGENLKAYWKKDGKTIEDIILESAGDYKELKRKCDEFSERLYNDALTSGGEEYAELLLLAYRQVMAAHKLVIDKDGNNLYISKECFSNGCAATVDVTYPSSPMYLLYNTELLKGMLRPILKYAEMSAWKWDFAPHDVGTYPVLNGQTYCDNEENQMPVEECGNMIILIDAVCRREKNYSLANDNIRLLKLWSKYLEKYGEDPGNQLCTDDFAGHMPHNVNLSIKAVMGLIGFSDILRALGDTNEAERIEKVARKYADSACVRAKDNNGGYRLAFDRAGTFSLKYNAVWDKLWNSNVFTAEFYQTEIDKYKEKLLPYGIPLDSREKYTKSDWEIWAACFSEYKEEFEQFVHSVYAAFDTMHTRVPMTDWYYADTSNMVTAFRNRSVQGGLFMKLIFEKMVEQS